MGHVCQLIFALSRGKDVGEWSRDKRSFTSLRVASRVLLLSNDRNPSAQRLCFNILIARRGL